MEILQDKIHLYFLGFNNVHKLLEYIGTSVPHDEFNKQQETGLLE